MDLPRKPRGSWDRTSAPVSTNISPFLPGPSLRAHRVGELHALNPHAGCASREQLVNWFGTIVAAKPYAGWGTLRSLTTWRRTTYDFRPAQELHSDIGGLITGLNADHELYSTITQRGESFNSFYKVPSC